MKAAQQHIYTFIGDLRSSFTDLSVIIGIIVFFQLVVIRSVPSDWLSMVIGILIVGVGLALFMRGLEIGIFPLGENLAHSLATNSSRFWIILFAFIIGFATTIAEPALIAIAQKAAIISDGQINAVILRLVVALAVGFAIVLGVIRIILNHPIHWYIISGYAIVLGVTYFAPQEIIGLAYDSGGVTTSTVTVPLIVALGIGLASTLKNRNAVIDGFGLIAFASLTPMIFVQLYGIIAYSLPNAGVAAVPFSSFPTFAPLAAVATIVLPGFFDYIIGFFKSFIDILPIILTILFFYYVVLRQKIETFPKRAFGFVLVILGLYAFVVGLEVGLFPIGETIAGALAEKGNLYLIYIFAFTVGFATTIAEPSLTAITKKAEEISGGSIKSTILRLVVAVGVGCGILLGAYRIVNGDAIVWYIMAGYAVVVVMTFLAPRTIIPIAYDSGGVTTSTITVPIVAALGLGLASTIPGRDPLIDGFGLIAFASLFPMISVLGYGITQQRNIRKHEKRLSKLQDRTMSRIVNSLQSKAGEEVSKKNKLKIKRKQIVTITGTPGSGVSSVSRGVSSALGYRYFSIGDIFRSISEKQGVSVERLNELAEDNNLVDSEIDQLIMELGQSDNKLVFDSRLAYHWINRSFKVYLEIDPNVAAERIHNQSKEGETMSKQATTYNEALTSIKRISTSEHKRYQDLYGLDITNTNPFDLVIDTENHDIESVVKEIVREYNKWREGN